MHTTTRPAEIAIDDLGDTIVRVKIAVPLLSDAELDALGRACADEKIMREAQRARELRLFGEAA